MTRAAREEIAYAELLLGVPAAGIRAAQLVPIAIITQDQELTRLLAHLGLPTEFPKTKPARGPPSLCGGEDSQIDPVADAFDGKDQPPADE